MIPLDSAFYLLHLLAFIFSSMHCSARKLNSNDTQIRRLPMWQFQAQIHIQSRRRCVNADADEKMKTSVAVILPSYSMSYYYYSLFVKFSHERIIWSGHKEAQNQPGSCESLGRKPSTETFLTLQERLRFARLGASVQSLFFAFLWKESCVILRAPYHWACRSQPAYSFSSIIKFHSLRWWWHCRSNY